MKQVRILFVCTANICRSPTAEAVLRQTADEAGLGQAVEVDSCGIGDSHIGEIPAPGAINCSRRHGYDLSPLRARQLRSADFSQFDLILAMDKSHLNWLKRLKSDQARVERFLDYATNGKIRRDVPDPFGGSGEDYENVFQRIAAVMPSLLANIQRDFLTGS